MSELEAEAWTIALEGEVPDWVCHWGPNTGAAKMCILERPTDGCFETSRLAQSRRMWSDFDSLNNEIALHFDIAADERLEPLNAGWRECMSDAGHGDLFTWPNLVVMPSHIYSMLFNEWANIENSEFNQELITEFASREVALAIADRDCRDVVNYDFEQHALELIRQQELIDRIGDELEAWASFEEARRARRG
ncbi:MAG: hypothetical protein FWG25_07825 [Promicromonosporaceae bacterium]|nr:hypothetical protein [Promicromonosporaceae bacterium]